MRRSNPEVMQVHDANHKYYLVYMGHEQCCICGEHVNVTHPDVALCGTCHFAFCVGKHTRADIQAHEDLDQLARM